MILSKILLGLLFTITICYAGINTSKNVKNIITVPKCDDLADQECYRNTKKPVKKIDKNDTNVNDININMPNDQININIRELKKKGSNRRALKFYKDWQENNNTKIGAYKEIFSDTDSNRLLYGKVLFLVMNTFFTLHIAYGYYQEKTNSLVRLSGYLNVLQLIEALIYVCHIQYKQFIGGVVSETGLSILNLVKSNMKYSLFWFSSILPTALFISGHMIENDMLKTASMYLFMIWSILIPTMQLFIPKKKVIKWSPVPFQELYHYYNPQNMFTKTIMLPKKACSRLSLQIFIYVSQAIFWITTFTLFSPAMKEISRPSAQWFVNVLWNLGTEGKSECGTSIVCAYGMWIFNWLLWTIINVVSSIILVVRKKKPLLTYNSIYISAITAFMCYNPMDFVLQSMSYFNLALMATTFAVGGCCCLCSCLLKECSGGGDDDKNCLCDRLEILWEKN